MPLRIQQTQNGRLMILTFQAHILGTNQNPIDLKDKMKNDSLKNQLISDKIIQPARKLIQDYL